MDIYKSGWYDKEHENRMRFIRYVIRYNLKHICDKLLDMGCYRGFLSTLLPKSVRYYGIDFKKYNKNLNMRVQNLNKKTKLPYPSKHFDIIIASGILEHLFYPDKVMMEIKRVLRDDGVVVVSLPNEKNLRARIDLLLGRDPPSIEEQVTKHHWFFTPKVARDWVGKYFDIWYTEPYIGLWGRRFIPQFLVELFPNLFCSDYFIRCSK